MYDGEVSSAWGNAGVSTAAVSVVIPVHNAAEWLPATLESVRAQTLPAAGWELIIVDDASSDHCREIATDFLERAGANGTIIRLEPNRGVAAARNAGWQAARGEWIQFLDADDLLAPHKLETQLRWIDEHIEKAEGLLVAVVYSSWQVVRRTAGGWQPSGPVVESNVDDEPLVGILDDRQFGYLGPSLIRRSTLERVGGFASGMSLGEDLDLMLRLAIRGFALRSVPSPGPLFYYRDTPDSLWRRSAAQVEAVSTLYLSLMAAGAYLEQSSEGRLSTVARRALARRYSSRLDLLDLLEDSDRRTAQALHRRIDALHIHVAPSELPLVVRWLAIPIGLGAALRVRTHARHLVRRMPFVGMGYAA